MTASSSCPPFPTDLLTGGIRLVVGVIGIFAVVAWAMSTMGFAFTDLCRVAPVVLVVGVGGGVALARGAPAPTLPAQQYQVKPPTLPLFLLIATGIVLLFPADDMAWMIAWIAAILAAAILPPPHRPPMPLVVAPAPDSWNLAAVLMVAAAGLACVLALARPDADDAYYVSQIAATLDNPHLPLLGFDGLHGDIGAPLHHPANLTEVSLITTALLAWAGNWDHRLVYYLLVPSMWALFTPFVHWALARTFLGKAAGFAVILGFLFLLAWGDTHRAYGNFTYLRLFQGKSVLVLVAVPLVIVTTADLARKPDWRACSTLALSFVIAFSLSATGLLVAPLAAMVALVAELPESERKRRVATMFALASLFPVIGMAVTYLNVREAFGEVGMMPSVGGNLPMGEVIGYGWRGLAGLFMMAFLPLPFACLTPDWGRPARYTLAALLLVFNGISAKLFATVGLSVLAWRLYWAVPLPLFAAIGAVAAFIPVRQSHRQFRRLPLLLMTGMACLVILLAGRSTLTPANGTEIRWLSLKTGLGTEAVAARIVWITPSDGQVLAQLPVAVTLAGLRRHPPLVVVRSAYLINLRRYFGAEDIQSRQRLGQFVDGTLTDPASITWVAQELARRDIAILVLTAEHRGGAMITPLLEAEGWTVEEIDGWHLWKRPSPS